MSNKDTQHIEPRLRFPEFRNTGNWEVKQLKTVASFLKGKGLPKSAITSRGNNLCIHYGELFTKYSEIITTIISRTDFSEDCFLSIENDVLMPTSDVTPKGLAKACCLKFSNIILGADILIIRPDQSLVCGEYLSRLIRNQEAQVLQVVSGSTVFHLYASSMEKLIFSFPSLPEQQKIADCLSSLDELIAAESKKLDALKTYKKGLMQQLFPAEGETLPKLRFPEFKDSGNWKKIKVIDLASSEVKWSFTGGPFGSNLKSSDYTNTGIRIIQLQNIGDGEFIDSYKIYTSENKANELLSCNIYPREIILSKMGDPVARACLIPDKEKRYVMCSDGIRLAVDKSKFDNYFIYSFINSETFRAIAEKNSTGSTRKRIGLDILKNLKIMVPTIQEQQKIADVLSSLDYSITNQSKKMDALKKHKKGLIQQLFPTMSEL